MDAYPKELRSGFQRPICIPILIAAFFTIAKIWTQLMYPSADKYIKKMRYIFIMGYYSTIKEKEILPFATTRMKLEGIMLSEVRQTEKHS